MKETEVAQKVVEYLSDYDLYFEVPLTNTDIVAKLGKILTAIEVKVNMNFKVIEQAYRNKCYFHYSYIAVPYGKDRGFPYQICKDYGLGVLEIKYNGTVFSCVTERVKPKFNRKAYSEYIRLSEEMKRSIPGASGSDGTTITSFKITIENMERYISRHEGCTFKELFENIEHHYANFTSARGSIYQWISRGVIDTIDFNNGKLYLTDKYRKEK